ncbi:MAG TPA: patatin-like phospholipase family protein [Bacillota bacterium]|nr:patatin-like phospholipase family protein [Bacillota bacterium]
MTAAPKKYPRIILALGGGGARGFAHIGVLQVLQEADIKIAGIVGTSMGALIGSTFAAETDLYYLARVIEALGWEDLIDIGLPRLGLVDGNKIQCLVDLLTKGKRFEDLTLDFWAIATELMTGEEIIFKTGPLAQAIRASISIPGVFQPVQVNKQMLVDGGVVAGVPVEVAKQMQGDLTVAVNVGFDHTQHTVNNLFDVLSKVMDIMGNRLDTFQLKLADLVIAPQLGNIGTMHFQRAKECVAIGRSAAEAALPELEKLIQGYDS